MLPPCSLTASWRRRGFRLSVIWRRIAAEARLCGQCGDRRGRGNCRTQLIAKVLTLLVARSGWWKGRAGRPGGYRLAPAGCGDRAARCGEGVRKSREPRDVPFRSELVRKRFAMSASRHVFRNASIGDRQVGRRDVRAVRAIRLRVRRRGLTARSISNCCRGTGRPGSVPRCGRSCPPSRRRA